MTTSKPDPSVPRPPQVTMAGWVSIVGSLFLVIGMFDAVAGLRSIESRERVTDLLKEPQFKGLDIGVEQWLDLMHQVYLAAGAMAAAAVVLGWYVLRGHQGARIGLTVVALPLFIAGMFANQITASLVAVSAVILWGRPARDWFAGRPVRQVSALRQPSPPSGPSAGQQPSLPPHQQPQRPDLPDVPGGHWQVSQSPAPHVGFGIPQPPVVLDRRPGPLVAACITTWVTCALVVAFAGLGLLAMLLSPDLVAEARRQQPSIDDLGLTDREIRATFYWTLGASLLWSLGAMGFALAVFLRKAWARPWLLACALGALAASVLLLQAVVTIVTAAASAVVVWLLTRPEVTLWLKSR